MLQIIAKMALHRKPGVIDQFAWLAPDRRAMPGCYAAAPATVA